MKKIILFFAGSIAFSFLYSQTLSDLIQNKNSSLVAAPGFVEYIKPYLPKTVSASSTVVTPTVHTVKEDMVFDKLLATYHVKALLLDSSTTNALANSFIMGKFNGITPEKGISNVVLVSVANGDGTFALRWVILFFSEKVQKWVVNAGPMDHDTLFKKGTKLVTY